MFKRALAVILTTAFICFSTGNHALSEEIQEFEIPAVIDTPLDPAPDDPDMTSVANTEAKPSTERLEDNAAYLEEDSEILLSAQRNLITLGYLKGIADGIYGPMTEAACVPSRMRAACPPPAISTRRHYPCLISWSSTLHPRLNSSNASSTLASL